MGAKEFFVKEWVVPVTLPSGKVVDGIYSSSAAEAGLGVGIDYAAHQVVLLDMDAAELGEGDPIRIVHKGETVPTEYTCSLPVKDGEGMSTVLLTEVE